MYMENVKNILVYITKNDISIDKALYITVFLSILMIYGIFLSFLQFAIKDYTNEKKYMGKDLFVHRLVSKNKYIEILGSYKFAILFFLSIILPIVGKLMGLLGVDIRIKNIVSISWILINIVIALLFILAFIKCAKLILSKMYHGEERILKNEAYSYNQELINRFCNGKELTADTLYRIIEIISERWKDDRFNFDNDYFELVMQILRNYLKTKEEDFNKIEKGKKVKRQEAFLYNFDMEYESFNQIMKVIIDKGYKFASYSQFIAIRNIVLKYNYKIFCTKGIKSEDHYYNPQIEKFLKEHFLIYGNILKSEEQNIEVNKFQELLFDDIEELGNISYGPLISDVSIKEGWWVIRNSLDKIMESDNDIKINSIYYYIKSNLRLNCRFVEWLSEYSESNLIKIEKISDIVNMLSEVEKAYIVLHVFFYYSIYNSRTSWKEFDIRFIRLLLPDKDYFEEQIEQNESELLLRLPVPMDMHRFRKEMFIELRKYLNVKMDFEHLNRVREENIIDYRYYFVLRTICFSEYSNYISYEIKNPEMKKEILHFMSLHHEFFSETNFKSFLYSIRKETYNKIDLINEKFTYSFEELIIANFEINNNELIELIDDNAYIPEPIIKYILNKRLKHEIKCEERWIKKKILYFIENSMVDAKCYAQEIVNTFEKYDLSLTSLEKKFLDGFVDNLCYEKDMIKNID